MYHRILRFRRCTRCKGTGYIFVPGKSYCLPCSRCNWGYWRRSVDLRELEYSNSNLITQYHQLNQLLKTYNRNPSKS